SCNAALFTANGIARRKAVKVANVVVTHMGQDRVGTAPSRTPSRMRAAALLGLKPAATKTFASITTPSMRPPQVQFYFGNAGNSEKGRAVWPSITKSATGSPTS